jgi:hypothetical protein
LSSPGPGPTQLGSLITTLLAHLSLSFPRPFLDRGRSAAPRIELPASRKLHFFQCLLSVHLGVLVLSYC